MEPTASPDLEGRAALVTGGARRVGAAIARALHRAGFAVAVHYRGSEDEARALVAELEAARPGSAVALRADLLDPAAPAALVDGAIEAFGRLDVLVNNAASFYSTPIGVIDEVSFADLVGTNLKAPLFLAQAAAPYLREHRGTIVGIADVYADRPLPGHAVYCAAKGALVTLTRALAIDLAPQVRVNAVAPGAVMWPEQAGEARRREVLARTALERAGTAEDVAAAVLWLVRDARYTTGAIVPVDGGRGLAGA